MKTYIKEKKSIAFFQEKASPEFWDKHWDTDNIAASIQASKDNIYLMPSVRKYLRKESTVLEGGCGQGLLVHALAYQGYKAIGIDFAEKTIKSIQQADPELDVRFGDVRKLPFRDGELDGYISVGVIEHFWEGYDQILSEMQRTLRDGGYLFISFSYMSPLRKMKSKLQLYPLSSKEKSDEIKDQFYQFALDHKNVLKKLEQMGFALKETTSFDGIKGFKDEIKLLKPFLQRVYDGQTCRKIRPYLDKSLKPFASHCILLVLEKRPSLKRATTYIPFEQYQSIGGPSTFMQNLKTYMDSSRFRYLHEHRKAKLIFFPISFDINILNDIKNKKGKIIQRLDGIYYPSKHGEQYIEHNREIKDIYLNYSEHIIFQSEYSKKQCFEMLGEKKDNEYTVIINGVHKNIFYPDKEKKSIEGTVQFVTTGNYRNIDMIEPVVKALDTLQSKFDFKLNVLGPVVKPEIEKYFKRDYIMLAGNKNLNEVAKILRESDIFIYSHLNPPCPNSVIEAISMGLPVVGFDSGAMSELLFFSTELLTYVSDDMFQKYEDFNSAKLADKIVLAVDKHEYYRKKALEHSNLYSFDECGSKYVDCLIKYSG